MRKRQSRRDVLLGGAGLGALAMSGCGRSSSVNETFDWSEHSAADVGMVDNGVDLIDEALGKRLEARECPGVVAAVARGNELAYFAAHGVRNVETGEPMRKDDIFRLMSSSKPVTAVAVLMLQDAGKLSIDDPVSKYIPAFADQKVATLPADLMPAMLDPSRHDELRAQLRLEPAERQITIKDLLTHTSGLASGYGLLPGPASLLGGVPMLPTDTLETRIPQVGALALDFQPGSRFSYSPLEGFDVLLHVVEVVSGLPADVYLRERLFGPLDMLDTGFIVPAEKRGRLVPIYGLNDGGEWEAAEPLFSASPDDKYFSGAGGLTSTVQDFMHYELMLLGQGSFNGRRILQPDTVRQMATNQVGSLFAEWIPPLTTGTGFGLGVRVTLEANAGSPRGVGSFGWGGAYGTESWVDPERNLAVVDFIQNAQGRVPNNPEFFANAIIQAFPTNAEG